MGEFVDATMARVPRGFDFSDPLRLLFAWVEDNGFVVTGHDGDLYGSLSGDPPDRYTDRVAWLYR